MNILPKKRWHVRTKDNIARVRRDEAEALEQERKRQGKQEFAESEARINFLRQKSGLPERQPTASVDIAADADTADPGGSGQHVNLFSDYKSHIKTTNKELEKEKKEEQEKYEKQIGYLTYLGQDTNEALKLRSWYEVAPKRAAVGDPAAVEKDLKSKHSHDPLTLINALLPPVKTIVPKRKRSPSPSKSEGASETVEVPAKRAKSTEQTNKVKVKKHRKEKKHKKEKRHKREKREKRSKKEKRRQKKLALEEEERKQKQEKLQKLREERLRREAKERIRQEALLAPSKPAESLQKDSKAVPTPRIVQKYNSQFNPELAKQNML